MFSVSVHAQADTEHPLSIPTAKEVMEHLLTVLSGELISEIHFATEDRIRQLTARRYYGTLFVLWFGTQERNGNKIFDLDMQGYLRGFQQAAEKEHFVSLIDYDDPLSWTRVPPGVDRQDIIDVIGGMPYFTWVLQQTKEPAAYKDSVRRFRELMTTAQPNK